MKKKWLIVVAAFLILCLLVHYKKPPKKDLFSECFVDPPIFCEVQGISPSITLFSNEIIDASKSAGICEPALPSFQSHDSTFLQQTAFMPITEKYECRCTYFIYIIDNRICSIWIEASLLYDGQQMPNTTTIFSALDSQAKIQESMKEQINRNALQ